MEHQLLLNPGDFRLLLILTITRSERFPIKRKSMINQQYGSIILVSTVG